MSTIAFAPAMLCLWASSRVRSSFRGISAYIAAEDCRSVRRFAVDEQRDLQFQDVATFAEAKFYQLHAADVARFPLGSFERLFGLIGRRPFHVLAALLHGLRIDLVGFLFLHVNEQRQTTNRQGNNSKRSGQTPQSQFLTSLNDLSRSLMASSASGFVVFSIGARRN